MKYTQTQKKKFEKYVLDFCVSENRIQKLRIKEEFNRFVRLKKHQMAINGETKRINLFLAFESYLQGLGNYTPFVCEDQEKILNDLEIQFNEINISDTFYRVFTRAFAWQFKKYGFADFSKQHELKEIK